MFALTTDFYDEFGDGDGVTYMLTGNKHAAVLVVSLMSLRDYYRGPVCVICGNGDAQQVVKRIADDERLTCGALEVVCWQAPVGGGKGLQHANKCNLIHLSPFERTVFLDADTLVVGPVNRLLPREGTEEVRLTRFASWVTTGHRLQQRIARWKDLLPAEAAMMSATPYPAINTGTFGFSKLSTAYFARLKELCEQQPIFMCDEIVAQLIFPHFPHVIMPDEYNYSCLYSETPISDAKIIHFHGHKHCRCKLGEALWMPQYERACAGNLAGIHDWTPGGDKQLRKRLKRGAPQQEEPDDDEQD
jgi:hypothetical protein